jgi:endonuclease/exonuclease/phosphatase family metal-dependent hydrolase
MPQYKCRLFVLALFFILGAGAFGDSVRIATYNVRNYLVMDRHVGGTWRPSYPKPESEKTVIRKVIRSAAPDILVLQEIGTVDFLEELRADLASEGLDYPYAIHLEGADTERHLALLSKLPAKEVVKHTDLEFNYLGRRETVKRGLLEASFEGVDGRTFTIFSVHLKSRWTTDKEDPESALRRTREAEVCRDRIIERTLDQGNGDFIIAGDFNDHPNTGTMRRFYRRGDLAIGSLLPAADSRGELWTYFYEKAATYQLVDGFVVSSELKSAVKAGEGKIVDIDGALSGSDHRMVYADLVFDKIEAAP